MEITGAELASQYQQASLTWPFIHQAELAQGLPRMLLSGDLSNRRICNMDLDATVRSHLEAATADSDIAAEDKNAKAEKAIWA